MSEYDVLTLPVNVVYNAPTFAATIDIIFDSEDIGSDGKPYLAREAQHGNKWHIYHTSCGSA